MKKTICIVEDDPSYHKFYKKTLQELYNIEAFFDGAEAMDVLAHKSPDLLIVDMNIPGKTGLEIITEYKKIDKNVPIIVCSSKEGIKTSPEIITNPQVKQFLVKPIEFRKLPELIQGVFDKINEKKETKKKNIDWQGNKIAGCSIEGVIGAGSGGKVYRAKRFGEPVAVKVLEIFDEQEFARFKLEIKSMAKIQHPNIMKLLDAGMNPDGSYYIVMEFFEGGSLDSVLKEERYLPMEECLFITREIAKGMKLVHAQKIIHRDLKPSNVLYNREKREVKLIDFGISKEIQGKQITQQGRILGTPLYMSPEQCLGEEIDHRTDIYSLGCVFYHLLSGKPPFENDSIYQIMTCQVREPVVWLPHTKIQVPKIVLDFVEKMMEKKREQRVQRMADVEVKLEEYLQNHCEC